MHLPRIAHQRARGRAEVALRRCGDAVRIDRLFQQGCAKAILPRSAGPTPEVVLLNTAGGLTGGDTLDIALTLGPGAAAVATTQTAERVYRALEGPARVSVRLEVGPAASLDWLPQETILFDRGRLERRMDVELARDARLTLLETLVLGRAAMGERVTQGHFADHWRIRRDGRLIHAEALRLSGDLAAATGGTATMQGARAAATLVQVGHDGEAGLGRARAALAAVSGVHGAASLRGDVLILRFLSPDHAPLRAALVTVLTALRAAPPPRVWSLQEPAP